MAKFDPSRVTGGTIELVRNDDGSYTSQVTGFNQIATLNLPDITTTATTSTTTTDAAEEAQETLEEQTSTAFKMPSIMAKEEQSDTANFDTTMTQEAAQTSKLLTDTFEDPIKIKSPTNVFYDEMDQTTNQVNQPELGDPSPILNILNEAKVKEDDTTITLSKSRIRGPQDLGQKATEKLQSKTTRVPQGPDPLGIFSPKGQRDQRFTDDAGMPEPPAYDYPELGPALGITTTREAKEKDFSSGTLGITVPADQDLEADIGAQVRGGTLSSRIKPAAKQTFFSSVKKNIKNIQIPSIGLTVMRAVAGPETPVQSHAKKYFNVTGNGRIAGNASTDLYAGMNRTSAFGNLEKAGENRIETREKTIERKGYAPGDKFYDDTQRMKEQQNNYKDSLDDVVEEGYTRTRAERRANPGRQDANTMTGGADTGSGGKSIVCTAMYQTTGLEDWSKAMKIWYIYQKKYLTIQHQKGYHILFKPFVKAMHKSNIIKALGAHVAKHRTQDLKHIMFNSKPSLIGRIYRKILEPICYVVGKLWQ